MGFNNGHIPWNKGLKLSNEYRDKMSKSHKGQIPWNKDIKMSDEFRNKISEIKKGKPSPRKGVKLSQETKDKISKSKIGSVVSEETKMKISNSLKGHISYTKGMKFSDKTKDNMSLAQKWRWAMMNEEEKELQIKNLINAPKNILFETSIEKKVEKDLKFYDIRYIKQKFISNGNRVFVLDFYIPNLKLVIECNGDYWHNLPERKQRDKELKKYVESTGRKIIFIWEHEINDDWFDILDYIKY